MLYRVEQSISVSVHTQAILSFGGKVESSSWVSDRVQMAIQKSSFKVIDENINRRPISQSQSLAVEEKCLCIYPITRNMCES